MRRRLRFCRGALADCLLPSMNSRLPFCKLFLAPEDLLFVPTHGFKRSGSEDGRASKGKESWQKLGTGVDRRSVDYDVPNRETSPSCCALPKAGRKEG